MAVAVCMHTRIVQSYPGMCLCIIMEVAISLSKVKYKQFFVNSKWRVSGCKCLCVIDCARIDYEHSKDFTPAKIPCYTVLGEYRALCDKVLRIINCHWSGKCPDSNRYIFVQRVIGLEYLWCEYVVQNICKV